MEPEFFFVKRYPHGKVTVSWTGDPALGTIVEEVVCRCLRVGVTMDRQLFDSAMRYRGFTDEDIVEYLKDLDIDDELYLKPD